MSFTEHSEPPQQSNEVRRLQFQVAENKTSISKFYYEFKPFLEQMKTKLGNLEHQIIEIADKTDKYNAMTDDIIIGISRRIEEAEIEYDTLK